MSDEFDQVRSFVFEGYPVRGAWVRLKASFLANCAHHDYPLVVRTVLGEALAASVLLGNSIKLNGLMTLQLQGPGPLTLLVVQLTDRLSFRGVARYQTPLPVDATSLKALSGEGSLFVTIDQANSDHRYQGIVAMGEGSLAHSLQDYFERSEQLPTKLWLRCDGEVVTGFMVQKLPGSGAAEASAVGAAESADFFEECEILANTVTGAEWLNTDCETLLHRLFHERDVRLFESKPVFFQCGCSRERVDGIVRSLGQEEVESILVEQGVIDIRCEFCNRLWSYDAVDAKTLLATDVLLGSKQRH